MIEAPVMNHPSSMSEILERIREQRRRAVAVLESLLADREACASHCTAADRPDALVEVTGVSSIDRAIESTRRIIESLDRQLAALTQPCPA